jgi:lysophospholipase L1-like esterase
MAWLTAAVIAGAVVVAVLEMGSRWWLRRRSRYYIWPPGSRIEMRVDPEACPELEPVVRFDSNAAGERGAEVPENDKGLCRILVAGGSAVECFMLDQPTTWPAALERRLNAPDSLRSLGARRVHVGNIGRSGVGSAELDLVLEHILPQYGRLDAILIMVGASDIYHWMEMGAPPTRAPEVVSEMTIFSCHPQRPFGWKPGQLALTEVIRRVRHSWFHPVEIKERAGAWFAKARRMRAEAKEVRDTMPDASNVLANFERHFRRVLERALARADRVLVVRQPWFENPYTPEEEARFWNGCVGMPWKETVGVFYSFDVLNRLLGLVDARAAKVASALGVPHLDLRPVLTGGLDHYYDHDHFTRAGATVVAETVAAALLRRDHAGQGRAAESCDAAVDLLVARQPTL